MAEIPGVTDQQWDAVVIGTGIGGATLGFALAQSGWRVLFCEKGRSQLAQSVRGGYAECYFSRPGTAGPSHSATLAHGGRYHNLIEDRSDRHPRTFVPFIGSGTGGSSALYGMAMERFFPSDFLPRSNLADATESSLPDAWPISYDELAPYYDLAEELYGVCGTADPLRGAEPREHLRSPPPLTRQGLSLFEFFQRSGLHPYRLPMACDFVPGCQCCQGYLCPYDCKRDSSRVCLQPALQAYGACLLDKCEALRLEATQSRVTSVVCNWRGEEVRLRGNIVVLAAGAFGSPGLLLASTSSLWPNGLANESGLVGRNLMRHFSDLYAIFLPDADGDNRRKEIAFNDFYHVKGQKLGNVQSFGRLPPPGMLVESLRERLREGRVPWAGTLLRAMRPATEALLRRLVDNTWVFAAIVEDPPYADNRVSVVARQPRHSGAMLAVHYRIRPCDLARIKALRTLLRELVSPYRFMLIKQAESNRMLAHACGTCRFGLDPSTSVLGKNNRAHGVENLYVVDGSFFPSSAGTNPALTIAANALRVAAAMHASGPQESAAKAFHRPA